LSPEQAWSLLASEPRAVLVDCRSRPEWAFVGLPDLSSLGKAVARIEWQIWPGMTPNASFADELGRGAVDPDQPVIFLCRSGARSRAAAITMTAQGYRRCFNLAGGFEGPHDAARHRGIMAGWKAAGLPWTQE
jgi:rhodanese-related sulfurtransferase